MRNLSVAAFIVLITALKSSGQNNSAFKYNVDFFEKPSDAGKAQFQVLVYKGKPEDSLWQREMYYVGPPGTLRSKGFCIDSAGLLKQGINISYYLNGKKMNQANFEKGKKEGEFITWNEKGRLFSIFHFTNDLMSGTNLSWYDNGKVCDSFMLDKKGSGYGSGYYYDGSIRYKGHFENGVKNGEWIYYFQGPATKKSMLIVFKDDKAETTKCFDDGGLPRETDCIYEQEAEYPGGIQGWTQYILKTLKNVRSDKYLARGQRYQVIIKFIIDKSGNVKDAEIETPGIEKLDKVALKVINASPQWHAAIQYGQPVNAYRRQPFTFAVEAE